VPVADYETAEGGVSPALSVRRLGDGFLSIGVFVSLGPALFKAFQSACALDPATGQGADPYDRFTERELTALYALGPGERWVFPFGAHTLDFARLGRLAVSGAPSRLALLLHPLAGPWMAFRGAVLSPQPVPAEARPEPLQSPCLDCPAPCIAACPAHAPGPAFDAFDHAACAAELSKPAPACADACLARNACPQGAPALRYTAAQHAFHQHNLRRYLQGEGRP
jgi:epoxyqueuosine reductase